MSCSRPFYEILTGSGDLFTWVTCPYAIGGLGMTGVGMFVLITGFVGLKNWSESWTLPLTWLAIIAPAMAAAFLLPGVLVRQIAGVITLAVVGVFIGLYWWWGRS